MKEPKLIRSVSEWRMLQPITTSGDRGARETVGFVPTMGALHAGHETLLARSRAENAVSVLSIFVNPTQFDDPKDLSTYPKTLDSDLELARRAGVDYIFAPTADEMYPDAYRYKITEHGVSGTLCGAHRPGHFNGVLTVVLKLLNIIQPTRAYFGEKDYQQLELVRGLADAFFLNVEIVACPIVREQDGLAMSSRNMRLTPAQRARAPRLHSILTTAPTATDAHELLFAEGFDVEYVEDIERRRFAAVRLGNVRLIDNVVV